MYERVEVPIVHSSSPLHSLPSPPPPHLSSRRCSSVLTQRPAAANDDALRMASPTSTTLSIPCSTSCDNHTRERGGGGARAQERMRSREGLRGRERGRERLRERLRERDARTRTRNAHTHPHIHCSWLMDVVVTFIALQQRKVQKQG